MPHKTLLIQDQRPRVIHLLALTCADQLFYSLNHGNVKRLWKHSKNRMKRNQGNRHSARSSFGDWIHSSKYSYQENWWQIPSQSIKLMRWAKHDRSTSCQKWRPFYSGQRGHPKSPKEPVAKPHRTPQVPWPAETGWSPVPFKLCTCTCFWCLLPHHCRPS